MKKSNQLTFVFCLLISGFVHSYSSKNHISKTDYSENKEYSEWKFIVYGDTRSLDTKHRGVLKSIVNNTPDYKFIINVGDVVNDGRIESQWRIWQRAIKDILGDTGQNTFPPRYMAAPGNHDKLDYSEGKKNWKIFLPGQHKYGNGMSYFYFDYKNARFIVLNSNSKISGNQLTWLKKILGKNPKTWLFAIWHHPIYAFGGHPGRKLIREKWGKLLYGMGCDLIFVGHGHHYVRTKKVKIKSSSYPSLDKNKGTAQVLTGNGGAPLYDVDMDKKEYMVGGYYEDYGYTELKVTGKTLKLRHISDRGRVMDYETYIPNRKKKFIQSKTSL